jgi:hypothetical protein
MSNDTMVETDPHFGVHLTHCCVRGCKYGQDENCPVASGKTLPQYPCEDCTCLEMNPDAPEKAQAWWNALSDREKAEIFLDCTRRY